MNVHYEVFRLAGIATFCLGVFAMCYVIAAAPSRVASRLGLRGLKRTRALQNNETWATFEPLVRWLGVRVSGLPSEQQYAQLDLQISLAGDFMGLTADEFLGLMVLGGIIGAVLGAFLGWLMQMGAVILFMSIPVGGALPYM